MIYSPEMYQHDLDKRAYNALARFPLLVKLKEAYMANVDEKETRFEMMTTGIRITENQFPEIYSLLPPICEKLGIDVPELYYVKSKQINAATYGTSNPFIYVTSEMVKKVPTTLIASVLAHECGHIACKHVLLHSIARQLINGIDRSVLSKYQSIRRLLTPALVDALLYWDRCSELSADRAAVLCDESADNSVKMLLKVHGYDDINSDEFIKQAMDLNSFVNESVPNKLIEKMITKNETHPRMTIRAYECYEWANSEKFRGLINGTYSYSEEQENLKKDVEKTEILAAEIKVDGTKDMDLANVDAALQTVDAELERYTNKADMWDYSIAVAGGILAGILDALFVGEIKITDGDIAISNKQVNIFIEKYAQSRGIDKPHLKNIIAELEKKFPVVQDNTWNGAGISVSALNHHLADLAHHPTPLGLMAAIIAKFFGVGMFFNRNGEWKFKLVEGYQSNIQDILGPAFITGLLNWLVNIAESAYEQIEEEELPKAVKKLAHLIASTPMLIEVAKCADNWFGHLVSDMGGSKNTAGGGMGIPGLLISLLYEFSSLPVVRDTELPKIINSIYQNKRIDLRDEIPVYKAIGKQAIPVIFNEIFVRVGYFITHFVKEMQRTQNVEKVDWNQVIPFKNRTIDRMMTISTMTFTMADTAEAALHAAIESSADWVLFAGKFVTRFNYVGAGRSAVAIFKEVSNESRETQLIHEKMLLSQQKTEILLEQLQSFKAQLEEKVSTYLAEDIEAFMEGFDYIEEGIHTGNSNLVIKGNVIIQRVLGREVQFDTQEEFDELMDSDIDFIL